jgi:23S rRNA pseudouridine2605 synthase
MRVNKYVAAATGLSRRAADQAIEKGRVTVNGKKAQPGQEVNQTDEVRLDHKKLAGPSAVQTIMFNKPVGYVVSRDGQGSKTIYDLLPPDFHHLKPVGRLDKDSSGLLLLTNNGQLAQELTHPKYRKMKIYEVELDKPLTSADWQKITEVGVRLEDGVSRFELHRLEKNDGLKWVVTIYEGRNRQIRRSFAVLGYTVKRLHRSHFGDYFLGDLQPSDFKILEQ